MSGETLNRARGRWREILPRCGIDSTFLVNKHGPCPLCGGKDRFRFDDRSGAGDYICGQCGAGAGLTLVCRKNGWDFKTACREIDAIIGAGLPPPKAPPTRAASTPDKRRATTERLWAEARSPQVVADYLASRGITAASPVLRGHARCPRFDDDRRFVGCERAVLAPITGPDGTLQNVQRIYVRDGAKKPMPGRPYSIGAGLAVRLFDPADGVLGVAEGTVSALAAHELFGVPTWALLDAGHMREFYPPTGVRLIRIFADNDESYTGQEAAYALAKRLRGTKFAVDVDLPTVAGWDFADVLQAQRR